MKVAPSPPETTQNKSIVLAEDDLDDQELLIEAFTAIDRNVKVHTIMNGNKAIGFLQGLDDSQLPDLIILDYNLPEVNGGDILECLQNDQRYRLVPKIVWSTSNSAQYKSKCLGLGANAYMVKPYDIASIENMARQMLQLTR